MDLIKEYMKKSTSYKDYYVSNNEMIDKDNCSVDELFSNINSDIDLVLSMLNISLNKKGYQYWKDAIFIYILSEKLRLSICNEIYPVIAKKYNKTPMAIERAMRLCFENSMYYISKNNTNIFSEYFKDCLLYPHNGEILIKIVELISSKFFQKNKHKYLKLDVC